MRDALLGRESAESLHPAYRKVMQSAALAQLSRAGAQRSDKRPILSDLRDSGAIEQDADVIMFLHREEYYDPNTEDKNIAEVIVAKQRNGPLGTVKLAWLGQYTRFASLQQGGAAQ